MAIYIREYEEGKKELTKEDKWRARLGLFHVFSYQNDIFFEIPSISENKKEKKREKQICKRREKLIRRLKLLEEREVVLSQNLRKEEQLCNDIDMIKDRINGCMVRCYLACYMVETLIKEARQKIEEQKLAILVNDNSPIHQNTIINLAKKVRAITLVTNHIGKFRKLEKELLENWGIGITLSNNKRKSLAKAEWILNLDFPTELVNSYQIFPKAILINIEEPVKIEKKSFEGIAIQDYEIFYPREEEQKERYQGFSPLLCYEAQKKKTGKWEEIFSELEEQKVYILSFFGKNGIVEKEMIVDIKNRTKDLTKA